MNHHKSRRPLSAAFAAAILVASAVGAWADALHSHPEANGTAAAPLDIVQAPLLVPAADRAGPQTIRVELDTIEVTGALADGATYHYWTFNRKVPGPFIRARVGDTIEITLTNPPDSGEPHSVDFHAATGPGGGGHATHAEPGQTKSFSFPATAPGLYVYHCAAPLAATHIANGMYGLILVEPAAGLARVDREFYVMQGEIYTAEPFGSMGQLNGSIDRLLDEDPEYYVFNGAADALQGDASLEARIGETIRIFFGVGGPNKISSFHVVGEIFDRVYDGAPSDGARQDVSTIVVPPGGAAMVELMLDMPGEYELVDHALARVARGLVGKLIVEGTAPPSSDTSDRQAPDPDAEASHTH